MILLSCLREITWYRIYFVNILELIFTLLFYMFIRDEIKNYTVTKPLPAGLIKKAEEYKALAILKHSFPDRFARMHKDESPDLQDSDGDLGVEVTSGESTSDHIITSESIKYRHSKSEVEKEKILKKIQNNGGNIDGYIIDYPIGNADSDMIHVTAAFEKKIAKADLYRKRFKCIGLAIMLDCPLFINHQWGKRLSHINNGKYDFVALLHWSGVVLYDFRTDNYSYANINREDMDALKKLGRMAAEGIIKDDDSVWNCIPE